MSEVTPLPAGSLSAGAMLRAAREARGLEIDALAQVLKVPERRLVALEADRYGELPGMAFVRSLAQSYARQLGLDATKVLAVLPMSGTPPQQLENVSRGLQTPYREGVSGNTFGRSGSGQPEWLKPAYLLPALLLLAALAFWFAPPMRSVFGGLGWPAASAPAPAGGSASAVSELPATPVEPSGVAASGADGASLQPSGVLVSAPTAVVVPAVVAEPVVPAASAAVVAAPVSETVHSAPLDGAPAGASAPSAATGAVVVRTTGESWIEVRDARGTVLLSRTVLPGEVVGLDGAMPMRMKVGIANVTQVTLRGEPFSLAPFTRGAIANVVLK
ncbi:helix-turn-helix domain-containing protein [uncultured Sphaerotilus sp.]|uniref:helix-turn-helix domain-containing protein n=1 Tax=uncultured Sphaerotilus sp. TaxID=474984 RepID=UPI0030CA2F5A